VGKKYRKKPFSGTEKMVGVKEGGAGLGGFGGIMTVPR